MALVRNIVVLSIVAFVLMGMMAYYLQTFALSGAVQEQEAASKAARQRMERIGAMTYDALEAQYPPGVSVGFDIEGLKPIPPDTHPGSVTVTYPDVIHADVLIRVRWRGIRGESSIPPVTRTLTPP